MVSLDVSIDTGHDEIVHDAQLDFYGRNLATCSSDSSVKIFEVNIDMQRELKELREHQGPVWQVGWCHPQYGNVLASCGYDKRVVFYGIVNGVWQKVNEYLNHDSSVNGISWAPPEYGPVIASCSGDGSIAIVTIQSDGSFETKKVPDAHNIGVNAISWGPISYVDGQIESHKLLKRLVTGGSDNDVKIFREANEGNWVLDSTLRGHCDWVLDVAWRPYTLSCEDVIASCDKFGCVIIWTRHQTNMDGMQYGVGNATNNVAPTASSEWQQVNICNVNQPVWHLSWAVTGDILAVSYGENNISLWRQNLEGHWCKLSDVNRGTNETAM